MKTLLFLLLTLIHTSGFALQPLEHLTPVSDFFHFYGQNDYMTDKNIGFDKKNETIVLQFVELANHFSTTFIVENNKSNVFRVIYVTQKHPNKNLSKRNVKVLTRNISKNIIRSLINTYQELLLDTHYSKDTTNQLYMHGPTYQFYVSSNSYGDLFGETYSPQRNTDTYYLTETSKALIKFVNNKIQSFKL